MSLRNSEGAEKDVCVCILAHNEQKHIARTIQAINTGNPEIEFDVIVYANGCTDATVSIVQELSATTLNLYLRDIEKASKPNAWNIAFKENHNKILVFSDGDVEPEPGGVQDLYNSLKMNSELSLVCLQYWPFLSRLSFEKKFVGFMQLPIVQDYLSGQFYAIRRQYFLRKFYEFGISGLPEGLVAEDTFLELLVDRNSFFVMDRKVYYEPPIFNDYVKYLARMRWQEEQLLFYTGYFNSHLTLDNNFKEKIMRKISGTKNVARLCLGLLSTAMRHMVKIFWGIRIAKCYNRLGPVVKTGASVLSSTTRSASSK